MTLSKKRSLFASFWYVEIISEVPVICQKAIRQTLPALPHPSVHRNPKLRYLWLLAAANGLKEVSSSMKVIQYETTTMPSAVCCDRSYLLWASQWILTLFLLMLKINIKSTTHPIWQETVLHPHYTNPGQKTSTQIYISPFGSCSWKD